MSYVKQTSLPSQEPVSLALAKQFLRLPAGYNAEDTLLSRMITTSREDGERLSDRVLAQRQFEVALDSFPYYTDTIQSQQAYPPSYYSLPRYSSTLWNYSQMIKLPKAPLISVDELKYVGSDGLTHTLTAGTDFIVDPLTEEPRIFPMVGQYWPPVLYTPNGVTIKITAGFDPDPTATKTYTLPSPPPSPANQQTSYTLVVGVPGWAVLGILNLVAYYYQQRGVTGAEKDMERIERIFKGNGIYDFSPTRG